MNGSGVRTKVVVLCGTCGTFWDEGAGEPGCADAAHEHQRFDVHVHRDVVTLPDGTAVTAVSFDEADPYARDRAPDHGLYLDARWQPPWPHAHVDWPDFGVPGDTAAFVASLRDVLDRARRGERVEVGCLGGHGRTGTALAALAVLAGHPADDAVAWARTHYCAQAVETPEQEALVAGLRP
ncbi:MAG TPA: protein-tyrosine phosphatase family protein [Acidimicrobiales bacterium]